jgi:hypothetical protein
VAPSEIGVPADRSVSRILMEIPAYPADRHGTRAGSVSGGEAVSSPYVMATGSAGAIEAPREFGLEAGEVEAMREAIALGRQLRVVVFEQV